MGRKRQSATSGTPRKRTSTTTSPTAMRCSSSPSCCFPMAAGTAARSGCCANSLLPSLVGQWSLHAACCRARTGRTSSRSTSPSQCSGATPPSCSTRLTATNTAHRAVHSTLGLPMSASCPARPLPSPLPRSPHLTSRSPRRHRCLTGWPRPRPRLQPRPMTTTCSSRPPMCWAQCMTGRRTMRRWPARPPRLQRPRDAARHCPLPLTATGRPAC